MSHKTIVIVSLMLIAGFTASAFGQKSKSGRSQGGNKSRQQQKHMAHYKHHNHAAFKENWKSGKRVGLSYGK